SYRFRGQIFPSLHVLPRRSALEATRKCKLLRYQRITGLSPQKRTSKSSSECCPRRRRLANAVKHKLVASLPSIWRLKARFRPEVRPSFQSHPPRRKTACPTAAMKIARTKETVRRTRRRRCVLIS